MWWFSFHYWKGFGKVTLAFSVLARAFFIIIFFVFFYESSWFTDPYVSRFSLPPFLSLSRFAIFPKTAAHQRVRQEFAANADASPEDAARLIAEGHEALEYSLSAVGQAVYSEDTGAYF